jgi:hypothetical protein
LTRQFFGILLVIKKPVKHISKQKNHDELTKIDDPEIPRQDDLGRQIGRRSSAPGDE